MGLKKDYIAAITNSFFTLFVGVFTGVLVARGLSPLDRGSLASLMFVATTCSGLILTLISQQAMIVYTTKKVDGSATGTVVAALIMQCSSVLILAPILCFFFYKGESDKIFEFVLLVGLAAIFQVAYNGLCAIYRAKQRFSLVTVTSGLIPVLYLVGLIGLLAANCMTFENVMMVSSLPVLIAAGILIRFYRIKIGRKSFNVSKLLKVGIAFFPLSLLSLAVGSADRALIIKFGSLVELSYYVVAFSVASPLMVVTSTVSSLNFAKLSNEAGSSDRYTVLANRFRYGTFGILFFAFFLLAVGPFAIPIVYGKVYENSVPIFIWLLASTVVREFTNLLDNDYRALGYLRFSFASSLIALGAFALCGYYFIRSGGAAGVAQAALCGYSLRFTLQLILWRRVSNLKLAQLWGLDLRTANALYGYLIHSLRK